MQDNIKIRIFNFTLLSIFMITGITLLIVGFVFNSNAYNPEYMERIYDGNNNDIGHIVHFNQIAHTNSEVYGLMAAGISMIVFTILVNIIYGLFSFKQQKDNKKIWIIQLLGGLIIGSLIIEILEFKEAKNVRR